MASYDRATRARLRAELARTFSDVGLFSRRVLRRPLRQYQIAPAQAIIDAVLQRRGLTLAVMMPRQAGKNETAAHVEALLLSLCRRRGVGHPASCRPGLLAAGARTGVRP